MIAPTLPFSGKTAEARAASKAAADSMRPFAPSIRERVFNLIRDTPAGVTDLEICTRLQLIHNTGRPRRVELWQAGRVRQAVTLDGRRRYRASVGNRIEISAVWAVGSEAACPKCNKLATPECDCRAGVWPAEAVVVEFVGEAEAWSLF
jgi:hypothetical protein